MDIELKKTFKGQYDRVQGFGGFKTVDGDLELVNRIVLHLMTRKNELDSIPYYSGWGCDIWSYLKNNNTELTRLTVEELLKNTLRNIDGVKGVENVDIIFDPRYPHQLNMEFTLKTSTGKMNIKI